MSKSEARARNRRGEGTQLRADIVAAARELIEETGDPGAVTLRAVARRVGIAAPSIYAHFADTEQILRAVIEEVFDEFLEHLASARVGIEDPRTRLMATCEAYLSYGAEHPALYTLMMGPNPSRHHTADAADGQDPDPRLREDGEGVDRLVGAESFALLIDDVTAAAAAGASRTDDPFMTATALWVGLHGLVRLRADAPQFPLPDQALLDRAVLEPIAQLTPPTA
ncbi:MULTISPECIES: TetR/AcrR family transcriptional regulator [Arthrobacter]|uniref:TetR/AcrR family transcriptional regulator n=2 Tax=Arthrobacter TaxID=1663 RepID=A0ABU9KGX8_9MICC|nr:TetR/AcrR family transcriptional regulator [Arthrobacter sp. YJM1]MDP5226150.1 TetR/AcrR family transcriptional regulator [Arthrobacter sp. YJM1]